MDKRTQHMGPKDHPILHTFLKLKAKMTKVYLPAASSRGFLSITSKYTALGIHQSPESQAKIILSWKLTVKDAQLSLGPCLAA